MNVEKEAPGFFLNIHDRVRRPHVKVGGRDQSRPYELGPLSLAGMNTLTNAAFTVYYVLNKRPHIHVANPVPLPRSMPRHSNKRKKRKGGYANTSHRYAVTYQL